MLGENDRKNLKAATDPCAFSALITPIHHLGWNWLADEKMCLFYVLHTTQIETIRRGKEKNKTRVLDS
jgi:hypothetical protein